MSSNNILWQGKSHHDLFSPSTYIITDEKLIIRKGLLGLKEEEVRLYRILSVSLSCTLRQRICGEGTIHCRTADKVIPEIDLVDVKDPRRVMEILSDAVEQSRESKGVTVHELMNKKFSNDEPDSQPGGIGLFKLGKQRT